MPEQQQPHVVLSANGEGIDDLVNDYRAGRLDTAAFQVKVKAWKDSWHERIKTLMPGYALSISLDPNTHRAVLHMKPEARAADRGLPDHLLPPPSRGGRSGPTR